MMESNQSRYTDLTPAQPLDKKTLNQMVWKSLMLQSSFNYERMQAGGWLWGILPGLKKIHKNKEDLSLSMEHNLEFFNTHPFLVTFVMGIVLSLEQQKADINTIRSVRVAAMGPLGGIGDAIFWFALVPITAGITCNLAINGSWIGPILYFIICFGVEMALRYGLMYWSYNLGTNAISILTKHAKEFTRAASMLGVFIVGALTCNYANVQLGMNIPNGTTVNEAGETVANFIDIQALLDSVLPAALSLTITLICYWLIKKKNWSASKCVVLLLVIGIIGCIFGIFGGAAGDYKALVPVPWHA